MVCVRLIDGVRVGVSASVRLANHRVHLYVDFGKPIVPFGAYSVLVPVECVASDCQSRKPLAELLVQRPSHNLNVVPDVVALLGSNLVTNRAVLCVINLKL